MATPTNAVRDVALATGFLTISVDNSARILKQHKPVPLWPLQPQGGGFKTPHVTSRDLVNLAIAVTTVAAPDDRGLPSPITTGVRRVTEYRSLVTRDPVLKLEPRGEATELLFPGDGLDVFGGEGGLGGDLERLIDLLAHDTDGHIAGILGASCLKVELILDLPFPRAVVQYLDTKLKFYEGVFDTLKGLPPGLKIDARKSFLYLPPQETLEVKPIASARGHTLTAQWDMKLILVLADLWRDTLVHQTETKTAASPAREATGSPDQPDDESTKMGTRQTHRKRGEGKPQSGRESRSGHSYSSLNRSDLNERGRQDSAGTFSP